MLDFLTSLDLMTALVCTGLFLLCGLSVHIYDKLGEREPGEATTMELHDA